jgi:hypothetical protein
MATGDNNDDDKDGATTMTMTMATAQRAMGYNDESGGRR